MHRICFKKFLLNRWILINNHLYNKYFTNKLWYFTNFFSNSWWNLLSSTIWDFLPQIITIGFPKTCLITIVESWCYIHVLDIIFMSLSNLIQVMFELAQNYIFSQYVLNLWNSCMRKIKKVYLKFKNWDIDCFYYLFLDLKYEI